MTSTTSPPTLAAIADQIFTDRRITRQVQQDLMQLLLGKAQISSQEQALAQRIFEAIQQGRLRVVD
ncbi:hypothetical protein GFS31_05900 [Leptolyngbya sp. BL0902]|uniref:hypothetical protein n=1 Tax=Leptolyngbya sp. BL0902 TaxID=1115757 RepID=UPI0018E807CF|nr:hypothetical protein [Leptolyngbya sp. BL0902]QQE63919.1 hypothetical protein GFS31_05900 [Leptolyngbya sp. BL0902]